MNQDTGNKRTIEYEKKKEKLGRKLTFKIYRTTKEKIWQFEVKQKMVKKLITQKTICKENYQMKKKENTRKLEDN